MISLFLFLILLYQRSKINQIAGNSAKANVEASKRRANIGLIILGVISLLNIYFNISLHRGLWNGDFFSPFFSGL
jgi:hypothetical protein